MMNQNRQMRGGGRVLDYDEKLSPNERGVFNMYDEPLSLNGGACLRYMMNRYRKIGEHASDILNMVNRYRQIRRHVQNIW